MRQYEIGKRIRQIRQKKKWTIEELAEKSSTSVIFISRIERDKVSSASLSKLIDVADALDISMADLFVESFDADMSQLIKLLQSLSDEKRHKMVQAFISLLKISN